MPVNAMSLVLLPLLILRDRLDQVRAAGRERGDVPGWVLVTLMTAGLVTVLWALAGTQLQTLLTSALSGVTGPGA